MTRQPRPKVELRVVSICMADGSDISSPEAQLRIARALLSGCQKAGEPQVSYQPTKWCGRCRGRPVSPETNLCKKCQSEAQWEVTTRAAGDLLDKHGFKPLPAPEPADPVLWDALEGRR